jgi:hypothetical protein
MDSNLKDSLWNQFEAAIEMLENAMNACPDELWHYCSQQAEYWYLIYHSLFWLDLYLSGTAEEFVPPEPFDLNELDSGGLYPANPISRADLQAYFEHDRQKCQATIAALTDERARQLVRFGWGEATFLELLFDTLRHVQSHASELLWILGQKTGSAPGWVTKSKRLRQARP